MGKDRDDSHYYLALEYCNGNDLRSFVTQYGKLGEEQIWHIAKQLTSAIYYLHY